MRISRNLAYYRRRSAANIAAGLTAHGTPRKRRAKLTPKEKLKYGSAKFRLRCQRLYELGLTTRGTKRKQWCGRGGSGYELAKRISQALKNADEAKQKANQLATQVAESKNNEAKS